MVNYIRILYLNRFVVRYSCILIKCAYYSHQKARLLYKIVSNVDSHSGDISFIIPLRNSLKLLHSNK